MGPRHARLAALAALLACTQPAPGPASGLRGSPGPPLASADTDPPAAQAARQRLLRRITATHHIADERVLLALAQVPRHLFVDAPLELAYRDRPLPIGHGQTISQPAVVAMMTQALALRGGERVLEIGTGSGYQAAVLAPLVRHVYTIEIVRPLGEAARARLAALGHANVSVRIGDGYRGWPEEAPFDRIILTAAPPELPKALLAQLKEGGILVAPIGEDGDQRLRRFRKTAGALAEEDLGPIRFVPMVGE